ncbi:hypothetical protein J6590_037446 [Homalodisca vitripennis]|nr:hypothetical protein J6590_037446 [Homalodisca vitripennis]
MAFISKSQDLFRARLGQQTCGRNVDCLLTRQLCSKRITYVLTTLTLLAVLLKFEPNNKPSQTYKQTVILLTMSSEIGFDFVTRKLLILKDNDIQMAKLNLAVVYRKDGAIYYETVSAYCQSTSQISRHIVRAAAITMGCRCRTVFTPWIDTALSNLLPKQRYKCRSVLIVQTQIVISLAKDGEMDKDNSEDNSGTISETPHLSNTIPSAVSKPERF